MMNGVKYSEAPQSDDAWTTPKVHTKLAGATKYPIDHETSSLDEKGISCAERCAFYSCCTGVLLILAGILCAAFLEPIIEAQIRSSLPLVNGSDVFDFWENPPVTPLLYLRVFNLTNKQQFLDGSERPRYAEVGPYVYRQSMRKSHVHFAQPDVLRYSTHTVYTFAPDLTPAGLSDTDDVVTVPNVPLFGAMQNMREEPGLAKDIFLSLLESYADLARDTTPFMELTVAELMWGYPSILLTLGRVANSSCAKSSGGDDDFGDWDFDDSLKDGWLFEGDEPVEQDKQIEQDTQVEQANPDEEYKTESVCDISRHNLETFGIYITRNNTHVDKREINTGIYDLALKGSMVSWQDMQVLRYWNNAKDRTCNSLEGTRDPEGLPMDLKKSDVLNLFIGNLCRAINFKYSQEVYHSSFKTFRFVPESTSFNSPAQSPENACYCYGATTPKGSCLPSGLQDISRCQEGSPVILSWPHFLHGDPQLRTDVEGMQPDTDKHQFQFDVAPQYGITLSGLARLQMNVMAEKNNGFGFFPNIQKDRVVLPFLWLEEGIFGPSEELAGLVTILHTTPEFVKTLLTLILLGLGFLLLLPKLYFCLRPCCSSGSEEKIR